jgi:23S rRNA pseudouridine1911/1915/1917 synthase
MTEVPTSQRVERGERAGADDAFLGLPDDAGAFGGGEPDWGRDDEDGPEGLDAAQELDPETAGRERGGFRTLGPPVGPHRVGPRLDGYLAKHYPFLSRAAWQKRLDLGQVLRNGARAKASAQVKEGDQLWLWWPASSEPDVDKSIRELWRSGSVMAVFKPGGLPMHENGRFRKNTFKALVHETFGREWSAVHRLDKDTSGIVLCGATPEARSRLAIDWANREVAKEYLALAFGIPQADSWVADGPIDELRRGSIRIKKWVVPGGLSATTHFRCLDRVETATSHDGVVGVCLLEARPLTGRTNQIRVHAAEGGLPLVGDKLYHPDEAVFLEYWEKGLTENVVKRSGFTRCALHAAALDFEHPETRQSCRVDCELPPDLTELWARLGGR